MRCLALVIALLAGAAFGQANSVSITRGNFSASLTATCFSSDGTTTTTGCTAVVGALRTTGLAPANHSGLGTTGGSWSLGAYNATYAGIWNASAPSATNFTLISNGAISRLSGTTSASLDANGVQQFVCSATACIATTNVAATTYIWGKTQYLNTANGTMFIHGTTPTVTSACTTPTVTNANGTASFLIDVGTTCAGVTTIVVGLSASGSGWRCNGYNKTTTTMTLDQTADTTTSVTLVNTSKTTGLATDFVDGADLRISCIGG